MMMPPACYGQNAEGQGGETFESLGELDHISSGRCNPRYSQLMEMERHVAEQAARSILARTDYPTPIQQQPMATSAAQLMRWSNMNRAAALAAAGSSTAHYSNFGTVRPTSAGGSFAFFQPQPQVGAPVAANAMSGQQMLHHLQNSFFADATANSNSMMMTSAVFHEGQASWQQNHRAAGMMSSAAMAAPGCKAEMTASPPPQPASQHQEHAKLTLAAADLHAEGRPQPQTTITTTSRLPASASCDQDLDEWLTTVLRGSEDAANPPAGDASTAAAVNAVEGHEDDCTDFLPESSDFRFRDGRLHEEARAEDDGSGSGIGIGSGSGGSNSQSQSSDGSDLVDHDHSGRSLSTSPTATNSQFGGSQQPSSSGQMMMTAGGAQPSAFGADYQRPAAVHKGGAVGCHVAAADSTMGGIEGVVSASRRLQQSRGQRLRSSAPKFGQQPSWQEMRTRCLYPAPAPLMAANMKQSGKEEEPLVASEDRDGAVYLPATTTFGSCHQMGPIVMPGGFLAPGMTGAALFGSPASWPGEGQLVGTEASHFHDMHHGNDGRKLVPSSAGDRARPHGGRADERGQDTAAACDEERARVRAEITRLAEGGDKRSDDGSSEEENGKVDKQRYLKRKLSNRASAKRSRQRRQELLDKLELDAAKLRIENATLSRKLSDARNRAAQLVEETMHLEETRDKIKAELDALRNEGVKAKDAS